MRNTCLLIFTDGRDYIWPTLHSFAFLMRWKFDRIILTDDSANQEYHEKLLDKLRTFGNTGIEMRFNSQRLGFAQTIAGAWQNIPRSIEWIFHLEDDFVLKRDLDLGRMIDVMSANTYLVQLALVRQPWNEEEKKHGGIWQWHSTRGVDFFQKYMPIGREPWFEHMGWFTTNPCLYPRWVVDHGWPCNEGAGEGKLMRELLAEDSARRAAYWGDMQDNPIVEHIGYGRKGFGY